MSKIKYSDDLKKEIVELYPREGKPFNEKVNSMAENGDEFLGRYLRVDPQQGIQPEEILLAKDLEILKTRANTIRRKRFLFHRWQQEMQGCGCKNPVVNVELQWTGF